MPDTNNNLQSQNQSSTPPPSSRSSTSKKIQPRSSVDSLVTLLKSPNIQKKAENNNNNNNDYFDEENIEIQRHETNDILSPPTTSHKDNEKYNETSNQKNPFALPRIDKRRKSLNFVSELAFLNTNKMADSSSMSSISSICSNNSITQEPKGSTPPSSVPSSTISSRVNSPNNQHIQLPLYNYVPSKPEDNKIKTIREEIRLANNLRYQMVLNYENQIDELLKKHKDEGEKFKEFLKDSRVEQHEYLKSLQNQLDLVIAHKQKTNKKRIKEVTMKDSEITKEAFINNPNGSTKDST